MNFAELGRVLSTRATEIVETPIRPATDARSTWWRTLLIGAFGFLPLLSVALYNGYPTIFSDSGSYLWTGAFFKAMPPFRAPGYSMFTRLTSLGFTAWYIVTAQAAIVLYVLYEACDHLMGEDRKARDLLFFTSLCLLTVLTSLPWEVGQLMPDVFTGVLFLSASLLAFASNLHPIRKVLLSAVMMIAVSAHMSLLPVAALFVAVLALGGIVSSRLALNPPRKYVVVWLALPIVVAALATASLNQRMGLGFRTSPSGKTFLLARLFGDHLATEYLQANCARRAYISCRYLSDLPRSQDEFLFWHPLVRELDGHEDEVAEITRGAILAHPFRFVRSSAWQTLRQVLHFRTGDEIRYFGAQEWNIESIQAVFPGDLASFLNSRQSRDHILPLANAAAAVHTRVFWLSLAACIPLAGLRRFGRVNEFFFGALAFLLINAAVCATFAGVYDRYQGRVVWIVPMCLTAYACSLARESNRASAFEFVDRLLDWEDAPPGSLEPLGFSVRPEKNEALDIEPDAS